MIGEPVDPYDVSLLLLGLLLLGAAWLPRLFAGRVISFPIVYVLVGAGLYALPLPLPWADPLGEGVITERLTELTVIVALMGAGLKVRRPVGWRRWRSVWGLLVVTMPLTILATALLGWWVAGLSVFSAVLVAAVLSPTDPVLASDVQLQGLQDDKDDETRFALTAEAGLNDGLAFPFTNLAVAMAGASSLNGGGWIGSWLAGDVFYKIVVGLIGGWVGGRLCAWAVFRTPATGALARTMEGSVALAIVLITYGLTEVVHGYGFIAVFVAAQQVRRWEIDHKYHKELHRFNEQVERMLMAVVLVLLGGSVTQGVLAPLDLRLALVGGLLVFVVRPLTGWLALLGSGTRGICRRAIAFFGIRGIGSIYYLAYAMNEADFEGIERVWALVVFTILLSILVHGIAATPVMQRVDSVLREKEGAATDVGGLGNVDEGPEGAAASQ